MGGFGATCLDCGADFNPPRERGTPRPPCPKCGSARIAAYAASRVSGGGSSSTRAEVASSNDARARLRDFQEALRRVHRAVGHRNISETQSAVRSALETIHELNDCSRRGEWNKASWTTQEHEMWLGHIGARNAAHHRSAHVVHLVTGSAHRRSRDDLRWEKDLPPIRWQDQADAYHARLAREPVLPSLAAIEALLSRSIPA
jgi:predicted RNA-binding Zn-ribbon protein involved in translation (DUF1610 family)